MGIRSIIISTKHLNLVMQSCKRDQKMMKGVTHHMKNIYTAPELDIISFETEDVITTSIGIYNDLVNDETGSR